MAGYVRSDVGVETNIATGNVINASDFNSEYDAIESAFDASTGHAHDGTAGNGGRVLTLGPAGNLVADTGILKGSTTNTVDLGSSSVQFKDLYIDGLAYIDGLGETVRVNSTSKIEFRDAGLFINSSADGQLDIDADTTLELTAPTMNATGAFNITGDLDVDNINIDGNTIISTDTDGNIALTPNGTGEVDISKVDIDGGAIDGTIIGANSAVAITGTTITGTSLVGPLTGNVTGNVTGDLTGAVTGNVTGNLTGNVTGDVTSSGTSTFSSIDVNGGAVDGITLGTNSAVTEAQIDNININGTTIISSNTNGNINITPNGTGSVILDGLSYPQADGTTGQFLKTDGAGQLAFATIIQATGSELENVSEDTTPQLGGDLGTNGNDIVFADDDKAIFGDGSELQIYHRSDSISEMIVNSGLTMKATDPLLKVIASFGATNTNLYYSGNERFRTSANGILLSGGSTIETASDDNLTLSPDGTGKVSITKETDLNGNILSNPVFKGAREDVTVSATAATGTISFDLLTQNVLYYTTNASANFTVNFRGDGSNTLNSSMNIGESITAAFLVTNGATAYYNSAVQVDGSSVTPKWSAGTAPSNGNTNAVDSYTYTIIKTADATFTIFANVVDFS